MATKIIKQPAAWQPVTIEMTFETREELAVWADIIGNSNTVAYAFTKNADERDFLTHDMGASTISSVINNLADYDTWKQLQTIVQQTPVD